MGRMEKLTSTARDLATNPAHTRWLAPLLVAADAVLSAGIVKFVPYTEIDYQAYMIQIRQILSGERDYRRIDSPTGPLVYPGTHVWIYRALYHLTGGGTDIATAQLLFALLYLLTLSLVLSCYHQARAPPWLLPLLILSKRTHSIFLLRCFNDGFAVAGLWGALHLYQRRRWALGSTLFSLAVGVKMSVLLVAPAVGILLLRALGRDRACAHAALIAHVQVLVGAPFLARHPRAYCARAFELTRQFKYQWTVNWRFVPEPVFLSRSFAFALLAAHLALLLFFAHTRWIRPVAPSLPAFLKTHLRRGTGARVAPPPPPSDILTAALTANAIGMLAARSLHYQFFAWLGWASPWLLWRAGLPPPLVIVVWAAQEWAWNVFPSTELSSAVVVLALGVQVAGVWWGTRGDGVFGEGVKGVKGVKGGKEGKLKEGKDGERESGGRGKVE